MYSSGMMLVAQGTYTLSSKDCSREGVYFNFINLGVFNLFYVHFECLPACLWTTYMAGAMEARRGCLIPWN